MRDIWLVLYSIGLVQGLFLVVVLLCLRGKSRYTIGLLVLLTLFPLTLIFPLWMDVLIPDHGMKFTFRGGDAIPLIRGPLFFLYILSVLKPGGFKKKYLLFFLPFLLFILFPIHQWSKVLPTSEFGVPITIAIFSWFKGAHSLAYLSGSFLLAYKSKKRSALSTRTNKQTTLIYWLVISQITLLLVVYIVFTLEFLKPELQLKTDAIGSLFFSFSYFIMALFLIISPNLLIPDDPKAIERNRYKTSSLNDLEKQKILNQLKALMENEKPYLRTDLKIGELADRLEITSNTLSQVINELLQMNFNNLVNTYRVDAIKENIHDERRSLYGIALDHGFKSKSAFNRIFKEMTGLTPSGYKKSLQK